jgi:hypothetical protein
METLMRAKTIAFIPPEDTSCPGTEDIEHKLFVAKTNYLELASGMPEEIDATFRRSLEDAKWRFHELRSAWRALNNKT